MPRISVNYCDPTLYCVVATSTQPNPILDKKKNIVLEIGNCCESVAFLKKFMTAVLKWNWSEQWFYIIYKKEKKLSGKLNFSIPHVMYWSSENVMQVLAYVFIIFRKFVNPLFFKIFYFLQAKGCWWDVWFNVFFMWSFNPSRLRGFCFFLSAFCPALCSLVAIGPSHAINYGILFIPYVFLI
jgi:hypothetical protein